MPDIFVAPDETVKREDPHKRVPSKSVSKPNLEIKQPTVTTVIPPLSLEEQNSATSNNRNDATGEAFVSEKPKPPEKKASFLSKVLDFEESYKNSSLPLFTSYWQNPKGVYFETQEPNENIILFLRKHFITNFGWLNSALLFMLLPVLTILVSFYFKFEINILPLGLLRLITLIYYLFILNYCFINFLDWYYNVAIITKERVFDVELSNLVYKQISATKISLVQDVTYKQSGAIRSVFNYGDVLIQTAGAQDNFLLHKVPKPESVVNIMENLIGKGRNANEI